MKERPILFSGPMMRAILDGQKTQTRRVFNPQPYFTGRGKLTWFHWKAKAYLVEHHGLSRDKHFRKMIENCPYGQPGDRLWVRETWRPYEHHDEGTDKIGDYIGDHLPGTDGIQYRADEHFVPIENSEVAAERWHELLRPDEAWPEMKSIRWRPSIHMPRWACRLILEVKAVRVERLQDISEGNAKAEGVTPGKVLESGGNPFRQDIGRLGPLKDGTHRGAFIALWDSINAKRGYGWDANPWVWVIEFEKVKL